MAIVVNSTPKEGHKFVPVSQRGEKEPFTVSVKPLDSRDLLELEDEVVVKKGGDTVFLASGAYAFKVVKRCLVSWENISDDKGKAIILKKDVSGQASDESVGMIPSDLISEISGAITAISRDPSTFQLYFSFEAGEL